MSPYKSELHDRDALASEEAIDAVLACIATIRPDSTPPAITDDLIRARAIDSIGFVELLFVLEERSGRAVDLEAAGAEHLRTVAGLAEQFFGTRGGGDA
jgi:acyl carrier protein